ncbi:unnamed protein product [Cylindrotheca closterium]|uniref:Uncharacterized protein n=1 Tax=Cylindrotheca closterium TaxID=2856 RepID=A0AAD2CLY9_9STRA|nr:unnamed protein product [Cylindrotheca closterium]
MTTVSKKGVTFSSNVTGIQIMNIEDYTPSEISASWYNQEDMDRITDRCLKLLRRMESDISNRGKKYCTRGLEGHTALASISKNQNRACARAAVLMEQSKQWIENKVDDQAIADAYSSTTSSCQLWAQVVGKRDEDIAEDIYFMNENEDCLNATVATFSFKSKDSGVPGFEQRRMEQAERPSGLHRTSLALVA